MKNYKLLSLVVFAGLLLSACSSAQAKGTEAVNAVYTAAAQTLTAQPATAAPSATLPPTATPAEFSSPTPEATLPPVPNISAPATASGVNTASGCDNSLYISDVTIQDGTILAPDESFTKTWEFQNSGTCTWSTSYSMEYVSGNAMSGSSTALAASVSPGGTADISVAMVAPSTNGTYTGYWKLHNASGTSFGEAVYIQMVVSDSASTVTPTPTATSTDYTSTPTKTSTSTPASVYTSTPAASSTSTATSQPATAVPTSTPQPTDVPTATLAPTATQVPAEANTPSS